MSNDFEIPLEGKARKGTKQVKIPEPASQSPTPLEEESLEIATPKYDQQELLQIFDELIFSGEYSEKISIRNKLNFVFRTRSSEEISDLVRSTDKIGANLYATLDQARQILHLQYALVEYQGTDLRGLKTEQKAEFIGRLPGPIIGSLLTSLAKFDAKVYAACQEGEENF